MVCSDHAPAASGGRRLHDAAGTPWKGQLGASHNKVGRPELTSETGCEATCLCPTTLLQIVVGECCMEKGGQAAK